MAGPDNLPSAVTTPEMRPLWVMIFRNLPVIPEIAAELAGALSMATEISWERILGK